ncbi:MAG: mercury transporter MerT [Bradyrhizobium sp. PARBB1]|jgi:mercuric ion transport protein|uniref:mercuric transporter MerT family protein n=1 Tax=Bradyrhizobium sp. TaxID=376 RepID=UPI000BCD5176|nr:mercuric transporter MerT family protein [uncultured Bradyrhizobium sp.]OYU63952.1 MAG: mercury transporter MerT [Bradyrhizobium sp. PARBB1]QRI69942.1 mercury transporter MerT [Bradyrhizobium sp. PSBB068]
MSETTASAHGASEGSAIAVPPQDARTTASHWLAVGGLLGALGAASCCVIPFALFLAGVSGAWIGNLTALEPYQPIFAAVSLAFIGAGAWRMRKKRQVACADGYCATPRSDRVAKIGLIVAITLVVIAVGFPYAARHFL